MAQSTKADAGAAAQDYYTRIPSSKDGEFVHAQAQVADLNTQSFSESRRTGDGVLVVTGSQKARAGASNPTSATTYDNAAGSKSPAR